MDCRFRSIDYYKNKWMSSSPKPSPKATPRSLRKRFKSVGDILRCKSLPSVDSIQQGVEEDSKYQMGNICLKRKSLGNIWSDEEGDPLMGSKSVRNKKNRRFRSTVNSTPTSSPRRQIKGNFFTNFTRQFRKTSRESVRQINPKVSNESSQKKKVVEQIHKSNSQALEAVNDRVNSTEADEDSKFVTFRLRIHLMEGHGLVIRDASGSSDPYVKFKYDNKTVYKSNTVLKSLNPRWNEEFTFLIHDPLLKLEVEVFDYDRFMRDDFMGAGTADLSQLKLFEKHQVEIKLESNDPNAEEYMGYITMELEITPMTEKQRQLFLARADRGVVTESVKRNTKSASVWLSVVNVLLVEARLNQTIINLPNQQAPDVHARLKMNNEKCRSKVIQNTFEPKWTETFDLHVYDETSPQLLDVMVCYKNNVLGKCSIDLSGFEREQTKENWYSLDNDAGSIRMFITISGSSTSTMVSNFNEYFADRESIINKYRLRRSFKNIKDVGHLTVKVYRAEGLASADIGGKSDPFCVLELVNDRLQTQTIYKTLDPTFEKLFTFLVKDANEVLELTVFDEDPNKKVEFLGKIAIPLLKIRNCEKRWYGLKDRKLQVPAKGRILLEMDLVFNPVKAALRTFNPREEKFLAQEQKFKRTTLVNNVNRLKEFYANFMEYREYMRSCLMWESYPRSITSMFCFIIFVYFFQLYYLPIMLLLLFAKSNVQKRIYESRENRYKSRSTENEGSLSLDYSDDEDERTFDNNSSQKSRDGDKSAEKSTSIIGKISAIQDTLTIVQNSMDFVACLLERIRNTFNFTVPYLSYLAIFTLCLATIIFYFIPLRWIVMIWGINKFTKRLRKPHYIENNELLDFLSRVPSDQELRNYRELKTNCEELRPSSSGLESNFDTPTKTLSNNGSIKKNN